MMANTQPLLGVKAYVDVHSKHANHSHAVSEELRQLGAVVYDKLLPAVTHIIFKDGSKATETKARKFGTHIVSVNWVESCKEAGSRVAEHAYSTLNNSSGKKKQKAMQPKDFDEEFQRVSDKLARAKKRKYNVQIPSPLSIIADRINVNAFLKVPRTPPAMQRKLDELREKNASSSKPLTTEHVATSVDAVKQQQTNVGTSPVLPAAHTADVVVPATTYKAVSLQDDHVVPETPLNWDISARLSFSPSPEKNLSIPPVNFDSPVETEQVTKLAEDLTRTISPTLEWDISMNSFLNERLTSQSVAPSAVQADGQASSDSDATVDMLENSPKKTKSAVVTTNGASKTAAVANTLVLAETNILPNGNAKTYSSKKRKSFVPPFLKPTDDSSKEPSKVSEKRTDIARAVQDHSKPTKSIADILALHSQVISHNCKGEHENVIPKRTIKTNQKPTDTRNDSSHKLKAKQCSESNVEDDAELESFGSGFKGIRKTYSRVKLKQQSSSQEISATTTQSSTDGSDKSIETTSPALALSHSSTGSAPTTNLSPSGDGAFDASITSQAGDVSRHVQEAPSGKTAQSSEAAQSSKAAPSSKSAPSSEAAPSSETAYSESDSSLLVLNQLQLSSTSKSSSVALMSDTRREMGAVKKQRTVSRSIVSAKENTPSCVTDENSSTSSSRRHSKVRRSSAVLTELSNQSNDSGVNSSSLIVSDDKVVTVQDSSIGSSATVLDADEVWVFGSAPVTPALDSSSGGTGKARSGSLSRVRREKSVRNSGRSLSESAAPSRGVASTGVSNLVLTSLHSGDRSVVKSIVKKLGGYHINISVDQYTTHVVCGNSRRTMNALKGISYGCWVVSVDWVMMSLEAGRWLDSEDNYLMAQSFPGATVQRRQDIMANRNRLFESVGPFYVSHGTSPSPSELSELVTLNGGKIVRTRRACNIMIGPATDVVTNSAVVKENWILDCVTNQRLLDHRPYQWSVDLSSDSDIFE